MPPRTEKFRGATTWTIAPGVVATVDAEDLSIAARGSWSATRRGNQLYVIGRPDRTRGVQYFHRFIVRAGSSETVRFKNRNSLDFRKANLIVRPRSSRSTAPPNVPTITARETAESAIADAILVLNCINFGNPEVNRIVWAIDAFKARQFESATKTARSLVKSPVKLGAAPRVTLEEIRGLFASARRT